MSSAEYHFKQAETAARLVLVEPDPAKARALQVIAMEHYSKAKAAAGQAAPADPALLRADRVRET